MKPREIQRGKEQKEDYSLLITHSDIYKTETIYKSENIIFVKVNSFNYEIIIGSVYLNPTTDINLSLNDLSEKVYDVLIRFPKSCVIIGGDFNGKIGKSNSNNSPRQCKQKQKIRMY